LRKIEYDGELTTVRKVCITTDSNYGFIVRRLKAGMPIEKALVDKVERRGTRPAKLTPSEVLTIYRLLFLKEKTQSLIAIEFSVKQSTVSNIWRHKRWDWLTSPLRYQLEKAAK
jgi:DNA invertase Pin-like site-specific DNA recombinase